MRAMNATSQYLSFTTQYCVVGIVIGVTIVQYMHTPCTHSHKESKMNTLLMVMAMLSGIGLYLSIGPKTKVHIEWNKPWHTIIIDGIERCNIKDGKGAIRYMKYLKELEKWEYMGQKAFWLGVSGLIFGLSMFIIGFITAL